MTASQLQILPSIGPVRPVGLTVQQQTRQQQPRSSANMGVSNARTFNHAQFRTASSTTRSAIQHQYTIPIQSARRNLFGGSPEPGEFQAIFEQEAEAKRQEWLARFGFDTESGKPIDDRDTSANIINNSEVEDRLHPPSSGNTLKLLENEQNCDVNTCNTEDVVSSNGKEAVDATDDKDRQIQISAAERPKPYARRQREITEFYNSRRTVSTSDVPKPQRGRLIDQETHKELKELATQSKPN